MSIQRVVLVKVPEGTHRRLRDFVESKNPRVALYLGDCAVYGLGKSWRLVVCPDGLRTLSAKGFVLRMAGGRLWGAVGGVEVDCDLGKGRCWVMKDEVGVEDALESVVLLGGQSSIALWLSTVVERMVGLGGGKPQGRQSQGQSQSQ